MAAFGDAIPQRHPRRPCLHAAAAPGPRLRERPCRRPVGAPAPGRHRFCFLYTNLENPHREPDLPAPRLPARLRRGGDRVRLGDSSRWILSDPIPGVRATRRASGRPRSGVRGGRGNTAPRRSLDPLLHPGRLENPGRHPPPWRGGQGSTWPRALSYPRLVIQPRAFRARSARWRGAICSARSAISGRISAVGRNGSASRSPVSSDNAATMAPLDLAHDERPRL